MEFTEWEPFYLRIREALDIDENEDQRSQMILSDLLRENEKLQPPDLTKRRLRDIIKGSYCLIAGGGSSLEDAVPLIKKRMKDIIEDHSEEPILITADGATSLLLRSELIPDIIVTDLDGGMKDQIHCLEKGSIMVVHAHGDNIDRMKEVVPRLHGEVIGSTQRDPGDDEYLLNHGGFTDGDRAVMISIHLGADHVCIYGFDLDRPSPKITDGGSRRPLTANEDTVKSKKLRIAREILDTVDRKRLEIIEI